MKKFFKGHLPALAAVLAAVACVLAALCLQKLTALENRMTEMNNAIYSQFNNIQGSIGNISYTVSDSLEQQASILSSWNMGYAAFDAASKTAVLHVQATPREYTDATTAVLSMNGTEYALARSGNIFSADISISLGTIVNSPILVLTDGETRRTEMLNRLDNLPWSIMPRIYAFSYGNSVMGDTCTENGPIQIDMQIDTSIQGGPSRIVSADLVQTLNGIETNRTPMNVDTDALLRDGCGITQEIEQIEAVIPLGSRWQLTLEMTDDVGLVYRTVLDDMSNNENGGLAPTDDTALHMQFPASIYDENGSLIYDFSQEE